MTAYDVTAWTDFASTVAGAHSVRAMTSTLLLRVPALLMIAAASSLWLRCGGGLYWVTAAVTMGFVSATANAWVLLVEIRR